MGNYIASIIYALILLTVILGWFFASSRASLGKSLQMAIIWGLIFLGFIAVYGLWNDISRDFIRPAQVSNGGVTTLPRAGDGHYYATLEINGVPVEFLVDTGASTVVLTQTDIIRAGTDIEDLHFIGTAHTANGTVKTAPVILKKVVFGPLEDQNIPASVNSGKMGMSLLGMTYLNRFERIEVTDSQMRLFH